MIPQDAQEEERFRKQHKRGHPPRSQKRPPFGFGVFQSDKHIANLEDTAFMRRSEPSLAKLQAAVLGCLSVESVPDESRKEETL